MTERATLGAWAAALLLVVGLALALTVAAPRRSDRFAGTPIVVLGSSLTAYAVPEAGGGPTSLLGDGRAHRRVAVSRITEVRLLDLLDEALDGRPALVLVEVNPLLFSFADSRGERPCDGWVQAVRARLDRVHTRPIDALRQLTGRVDRADELGEPRHLERAQSVDAATLDRLYPLVLHAPCDPDRIAALAARAKAQGARVALLLPPRSPAGVAALGARTQAAIDARAGALAASLGVPIIPSPRRWSDAEFVDHAHVNRIGRAHLLANVRRWWRAVA